MRTIRGRLAVGYAALLGATIIVFAGITYVVQGSGRFGDLDARVQLESDLISGILGESYRARDSVIVAPDPATGDLALTRKLGAVTARESRAIGTRPGWLSTAGLRKKSPGTTWPGRCTGPSITCSFLPR